MTEPTLREQIEEIVTAHRKFCVALYNNEPSPKDSLTSDELTDRLLALFAEEREQIKNAIYGLEEVMSGHGIVLRKDDIISIFTNWNK